MTIVHYLLIALFVLGMLVGLWFIYRGVTKRLSTSDTNEPKQQTDKNGIPIIPRHERDVVDQPDLDDTMSGKTTITPHRDQLQVVVNEDIREQPATSSSHQPLTEHTVAKDEYTFVASDGDDAGEPDVFSSLASATEKLMPSVQSAQEPEFDHTSPVVDGYLSAMSEQDQNSPIEQAEDTVEILLIPANNFERISGNQLLQLVDTFGMRHGLMNLFHRYEHKDGTGILWFSMIGITKDGMTPFDLNTMPYTEYQGVALFLSLPHPRALQGFDSMVSIAGMMAKQLGVGVLNADQEPLTRDVKQQLRGHVQDYVTDFDAKH